MKTILLLLLPLMSSLVPGVALAQVADLYSGAVPVEDQSQSAREAAFPRALEQVLGKLSGLRNFDDYPEVAPAVEATRSLVVSFHYDRVAEGVGGEGGLEPEAQSDGMQTYLVARFSQPEVDELMLRLGLPRWPPGREPLTVWLLVDDGHSRRAMPLEYEYLRAPLDRVAEVRGLPLRWPRPAEDGEYAVDVQLLWGGYTETLSSGDSPGEVLVIAARREGPEWNARMILNYGGEHRSWRNRHIDLTQGLTEAMHQVVDEIAAVQAIALSDQGKWVHDITVGGLASEEDYARCLSYLESLSVVDEVAIRGADPAVVRMSLTLNAAPQHFEQAVAEDQLLEYAETSGQYVLQR